MVPRNNLVQLTLKYTYFRRIIQVNRRFWPLQMVIIHAAPELGEFLQNLRLGGRRIGFVPTMGALHDGHASLIRCAKLETDVVVLSIFVNPTQFNETADFTNYPKTTDADLNLARSEKVDVVFSPQVADVYGDEMRTEPTDYGSLTAAFEGESRPGHFDGVVSVVRRLFNIVRPDVAFFGEKDLQQLAVIRHLAKLEFPELEIFGCSLIRDDDGLALSSRNTRIPRDQRSHALELHKALLEVAEASKSSGSLQAAIDRNLTRLQRNEHIELEYFAAVDSKNFAVLQSEETSSQSFAIVAAVVAGVRLIDNCRL